MLDRLDELEKRLDLMECIYARIMQLDMRLDTLEFNSDKPVKPAISERMLDYGLRLSAIEDRLFKKENTNE